MGEITLQIDDREVKVEEGTTILEASKSVGIDIPTLCYHPALSPAGACRLCSVEIISRGRSRIVTSCNYPVEEGLVVNTKSPDVIEVRQMLSELMLARCPNVKVIQDLAREYGVEKPRFKLEDEECILCGLCARICEERIGVSAINFVGRGVDRKVETPFQGTLDINLDVCLACGACAFVCPTGAIKLEDITKKKPAPILSEFDVGLRSRAPVYLPFPQAVPNVPVIDREKCVHFNTDKCKICEEFCEPKAINFEQEDEIIEVEVGNIIVATGFNVFDPTPIYQYGYKRLDNVITSLEFERLVNSAGPTSGEIVLKDGSHPKSVAIIHCVGSRDDKYHEYCSRVCCMYSMKFAHLIKEHLPGVEVYEFYIDIRSFGKGYEEFYNRVLNETTIFIRGRPAEVTNIAETPEEEGKLVVQFEDTLVGKQRRLPVDMVILSVALEAQPDAEAVARLFNISRSADGFFLERHPKLDPVATTTDGTFVAGCCQGPKDIPDTVAQALAAAAEVLAMISKGTIEIEAATAVINERICSGCQICKLVCPYSAIFFDEEKEVCRVNEALCKGCGICVSGCPSDSITLNHFTNEQIVAQMEGMLV